MTIYQWMEEHGSDIDTEENDNRPICNGCLNHFEELSYNGYCPDCEKELISDMSKNIDFCERVFRENLRSKNYYENHYCFWDELLGYDLISEILNKYVIENKIICEKPITEDADWCLENGIELWEKEYK